MKAKHIKKLRNKIRHYYMWKPYIGDLFGITEKHCTKERATIIYGYSLEDAVRRYVNSHPFCGFKCAGYKSTSRFAELAFLEVGKPLRFIDFRS